MAPNDWPTLVRQLADGTISRRTFVSSALALGASTAAVASALAQEACAPCESVPHQSNALARQEAPGTPILPEGYVGPMPSAKEPLSAETVTLKIVVPQMQEVEDWATNSFTQWYEERTNVHVEWQSVAGTPDEQRVAANAIIAGGDLPDIFMSPVVYTGFSPAQLLLYGQQGLFIPLNDLIEEHGVEIKRMFADYPETKDTITALDGNIYSMPYINDCYHCRGSSKLWINKAWLDTLGLAVPQTTEEFYQALKAFKEQDPNGNGQADEIPLTSATNTWVGGGASFGGQTNGSLDNFFMGSFLYNPGEPWLVLDGEGKVDVTFNKPGWREGLKFLHRLHAEGLLAEEAFSQDEVLLKRAGDNPDVPIIGAVPAGWWGVFQTVDQTTEGARWEQYVTVPPLAGPDGTRICGWNHYGAVSANGHFVVTSACKTPDIAVKWADGLYELEAQLRAVHGVLGEDVRWADEGEIGINGKQGVWKQLVTWSSDDMYGDFWGQQGPNYRSSDYRLGEVVDPAQPTFEKPLYEETKNNYFPYAQDISLQVPPLYLSEEQAGQVGELGTTINNHVKLSLAQFTTGEADPNDDGAWNDYVDTLNQMGLEAYLQTYQDAYDAKFGG
jgi:putative aldouronate transport system substrate-binding protein